MNSFFAQRFDSFEELAAMVLAWDLDFRQLDRHRSASELSQTHLGSLLFSSARFGCHVDQRGATPGGMRTFAIPDADCSEMRWFGRSVARDCLLTFPANGELQAVSRPGFGVTTISVPEQVLNQFAARNADSLPKRILATAESVTLARPHTLDRLRDLSRRASVVMKNGAGGDCRQLIADIQDQTLSALLDIFANSAQSPTASATYEGRRFRFKRLLDYVDEHVDTPLRIVDLCRVAQVSERTLQNRFKRELGITPKSYLCGQRLYGTHRALKRAQLCDARVIDVANAWGFWHMGQFARDYRKLFGELPSETLRAGA